MFPSLRGEINQEMGLLHLEIGVFKSFTQKMINDAKKDTVQKCFAIAEKYYLEGNAKLSNAIGVSYIKKLEFDDTDKNYRSWSWECLPESLKVVYIGFHGHPSA